MAESFLTAHGAKALKSNTNNDTQFAKENIFFDWGNSEEHVVRLVGDFKWIRSHWIGENQFGTDITILNPSAFKGENKIPMNVACGNWDVETESEDPDGDNCPVCRLGKNADQMLSKYGKEMQDSDKEIIKNIRRKCAIKNMYLFKCIDRDNPYVDDEKTKKGFKIIKMPAELLNAIIELSKKISGINITSPDEGIDITIKRVKPEGGKKGKTTYTAIPVYDGMTVKQTPLTDEERAYHDLDLTKFAGKPVDKERFEAELVEENNVRTIYENVDITESNNAPF
ncbi:MAG: hypothetical protein IKP65_03310 [Alphaproteobacteria bacterium]|nr:hypothetical protein [Alphaproteobacteria bacterium]